MDQAEHSRLCAAFLKTFASVPGPLRNQIIVVVDGQPYTWESAFVDIKAKTARSRKILDELKKMKIIK